MHSRSAPATVERWPLAEVLTIYIELQTDEALIEWRHQSLLWTLRATVSKKPGNPPPMPKLVKARSQQ